MRPHVRDALGTPTARLAEHRDDRPRAQAVSSRATMPLRRAHSCARREVTCHALPVLRRCGDDQVLRAQSAGASPASPRAGLLLLRSVAPDLAVGCRPPRPGYGEGLGRFATEKECEMSGIDKMKNKAEELGGKGKEAVGDATDDRDLQAEGTGRPDQGQPQAGRREGQGRLQVGRPTPHCGCVRALRVLQHPRARTTPAMCCQRRVRRARTAGRRGRSAAIQSRSSSSSARSHRSSACSCATGAPPADRAHHTRSVDAPAARRRRRRPAPPRRGRPAARSSSPSSSPISRTSADRSDSPGSTLPPGELPAAVVRAARALRDEHPVAVDDRRAHHLDDVERRPRRGRRVRVEVGLHRPEDPPAQHHLVDEAAEQPGQRRSPSRPARRPGCRRRWPRTAGNGSATASRGPGPTA